ncbi:hypothetical protein ACFOSV_06635 [Algoriphagus namhaensis]|uniref:Uncharacterized protein n=1 Tax=Algoriphagus namhaensis TaxID=915353 RepID=A0ABV8AQ42_9BACT
MVNFFRKIRYSFFLEGKTGKYLKYAFGEILLVVIGILIAVYINTNREESLQKQYTISVFEQIRNDLINDSIKLSDDIQKIVTNNQLIVDMLNDRLPESFYANINETTYDDPDVRPIRSLCTDFVNFLPNTKGHELLKSLNSRDLVNDSLTNEIMRYYSQLETALPEYNKVTIEVSKKNIQEYKQYTWFENWALGIYDPQFVKYLKEDPDNRKRLAEFYTYSSVNETYWKTLRQTTQELISRIEQEVKLSQ